MENEKYICPQCGSEMVAIYKKPALNLTCPKCGCKIATTKWEEIDLDDIEYSIKIESVVSPSIEQIKFVSKVTGLNYVCSKNLLSIGGPLIKDKAISIIKIRQTLVKLDIHFSIDPNFKY